MFPLINGKSLLDCTETDLQQLLGNPDYRENDMLDYKINFAFLECERGSTRREEKLAEFRSDVCSFANAIGGFLLYGISEDKGIAKEIAGIDIPDGNTDRFELERKNNLNPIMPKMPPIQFRFIALKNGKCVVVIQVRNDAFTPYVHRVDDDYRITKRVGNGKQSVNYFELKQMFSQSLSLADAIFQYRKDRINYYRSIEDTDDGRYSKFIILHIIPETYRDTSNNMNMFIIEKKGISNLSTLFHPMECYGDSIPNVDGLRYVSHDGNNEGTLHNNGIAECFYSLCSSLKQLDGNHFFFTRVWGIITKMVSQYIRIMNGIVKTTRVIVGISIVGGKGLVTEDAEWAMESYKGIIDRNILICESIPFPDITNAQSIEDSLRLLKVNFATSVGIKYSTTLNELIKEL